VTQNATLSYQWQRSTDAGQNFVNLSGETKALLSLVGVTISKNNDQYRVLVSATDGANPATSKAATLTVPSIDQQDGWVAVAKFSSSSVANMLTASEILSDETVGSSSSSKYMLGNQYQGFTQWAAKVNGVWMNPVIYTLPLKFNSDPKDIPQDSTNFPGSPGLVVGTNADGGALSVITAENSPWGSGTGSASRFAIIKYSTSNYSDAGAVTPFNQAVLNGADNNFCQFSGGEITSNYGVYGAGFGCRSCFMGSCFQTSSQVETVEIWGSAGNSLPLITINTEPANQTAASGSASFAVSASITQNAQLSYQ
jgi:hypothetical protein